MLTFFKFIMKYSSIILVILILASHTYARGGGGGGTGGGGGGGFGGGYSGSYYPSSGFSNSIRNDGSTTTPVGLFTLFVIIPLFMLLIYFLPAILAKGDKRCSAEYLYPPARIKAKAKKTKKALDALTEKDVMWDHKQMEHAVLDVFYKLQRCWSKREYAPMRGLLTDDLYMQHAEQIESLKRNHEINVLENLKINRIAIIHLKQSHDKNRREFTALIDASVKDYYIDDRTRGFIRGDTVALEFQEFWIFQRKDNKWLLREIEQANESDRLEMEDVWREKDSVIGELAKSDQFDPAVKQRIGVVYVKVLGAFEKKDLTGIKELITAQVFEIYQKRIEEMNRKGISVEFRNLCVRKIDIIAFDPDNTITACVKSHYHLQEKSGNEIHSIGQVDKFSEYWTFEKIGASMILKKVKQAPDESRNTRRGYYT